MTGLRKEVFDSNSNHSRQHLQTTNKPLAIEYLHHMHLKKFR